MSAVDEYLDGLEGRAREALEEVRAAVLAAAPGATEVISYGIPTARLEGRGLVAYGAFKAHVSLFPMSVAVMDELGEEVARYRAKKGTLHFALGEAVPVELVGRIVRARVAENAGRARGSRRR